MRRTLPLCCLGLLALTACSDANDMTGINSGRSANTSAAAPSSNRAAPDAGPRPNAATTDLAEGKHRVCPAHVPFVPQRKVTPTPTPRP